jgi:type VI secretion system FHA domain protein
MDPLAPPPPPRRAFDEPPQSGFGLPTAAQLPSDFDPLAPEPGDSPFLGPTRSDHTSSLEDAFRPPATIGHVPLHTGGTLPGDDLLPDDWDKELLEGINPQSASPMPHAAMPQPIAQPMARPIPQPVTQPFAQPIPQPVARTVAQPIAQPVVQPLVQPLVQPVPQPVAQPVPQPVAQPVSQPVAQPVSQPSAQPVAQPFAQPVAQPFAHPVAEPADLDPFAEPEPAWAARSRSAEPPAVAPAEARAPTPFDEPFDFEPAPPQIVQPSTAVPPSTAMQAPAPMAPASAPLAVAAADGALLTAFLQGVGMTDVKPGDPTAMMRALGEAFRTLVSGLRAVLIARASIKSEFRIEQTMIRARGNNPLKFSAGDDDALAALLGTGRRTDMTAAAAVADALNDIRLHELASMAAMQSAVRAVLDGLDPVKLRAQADQGGGMSVLPAQKKARAWDAFEALHTRTVQALADDFDSVFGKAFARAYERALDDVAARER